MIDFFFFNRAPKETHDVKSTWFPGISDNFEKFHRSENHVETGFVSSQTSRDDTLSFHQLLSCENIFNSYDTSCMDFSE